MIDNLMQDYGKLTQPERAKLRGQYVKAQGGRCHHCGSPLSGRPNAVIEAKLVDRSLFPPKFFTWPIHLHHSRKTGMTIGAVHAHCNAVLWQYHGE